VIHGRPNNAVGTLRVLDTATRRTAREATGHEHGQSFADTVHGPVDLADWVKTRYDAGCLMLEVRRRDVEVGGIGRDPNTGERTWWAETDAVA
jgi:hypothetical protein